MRRRRVAVFLRSLDNDFLQRVRDDAVGACARFGFSITTVSAHNDAARQAAQIAAALDGTPISGAININSVDDGAASGPDDLAAILVSPVRDEGLETLARVAIARNVAWVLLNREGSYVAPLREHGGTVPIFSVTPDQEQIGRLQATQAKALAPDGGTLVAITGPSRASPARRRVEGMWGELGPNYALTLLEADWTTEGARLVLDRWLQGIDASNLPCLIAAQNDEMALGARQALRDAASAHGVPELLNIPLIGCDGSPGLGQRLVRERRLAATISLPLPAGVAVEHLAAFRDRAEMPPHQLYLPVTSFPEVADLSPGPHGVPILNVG